jgi:hypothetical protein
MTPEDTLYKTVDGVEPIQGVREYLWPETEILFVQDRLPCEGAATPLFGPAARKVWRALYQVGLVTRLFNDPLVAEETVFGTGQCINGNRRLSIMTFSWYSGTTLNGGRPLWFGDWERINKACATLKVKKLAYLGKKLATEGGRDWSESGIKPANPLGYLRDHQCYGHSARLYGLPLIDIGPESVRYFAELNA